MRNVNMAVTFKALEKKAKPIISKLERIDKIKTKKEYDKAAALTKNLKALGKEADAKLASIIDPLKEATTNARELFRPFKEAILEVETAIKTGMREFIDSQDRASSKLSHDFETGKIKRPTTFLNKSQDLEVTHNVRNVWTLVEVDASQTPREFLVPDESAIREAFKAGRKVKGWKYEQQKTIAI